MNFGLCNYFLTIFHNTTNFLFRPTLVGGGGGEQLYTQRRFFVFSQFWPIDIFIVEKCEWYH